MLCPESLLPHRRSLLHSAMLRDSAANFLEVRNAGFDTSGTLAKEYLHQRGIASPLPICATITAYSRDGLTIRRMPPPRLPGIEEPSDWARIP